MDKVRQAVRLRAGGCCERCGISLLNRPASIHHRRPRGMGGAKGLDTVANLVVLCGSGTTGCHGWVESHRLTAITEGWLVPHRDHREPEDVPVKVYGVWYRVGSTLEPWDTDAQLAEAALFAALKRWKVNQ